LAAIPKPLKPVGEKKKPISQFELENERAFPPFIASRRPVCGFFHNPSQTPCRASRIACAAERFCRDPFVWLFMQL